jgi:hypothetical protein
MGFALGTSAAIVASAETLLVKILTDFREHFRMQSDGGKISNILKQQKRRRA